MNSTSKFFQSLVRSGAVVVILALALAACSPSGVPNTGSNSSSTSSSNQSSGAYGASPATSAPAATTAPTTAPAATSASSSLSSSTEASINVATDPKLGKILVGNNGMTLYIFTKDGPDQSNCKGGCAKAWPPLLTQGKPTLGPGVDASMVGNAALADGTKIVTYNKMPLYYYAPDKKPGDTTGQGVGNVWYVIGPDGKPVGMEASSSSSSSSGASPSATPKAAYGLGGSSSGSSEAAMVNIGQSSDLGKFLVDGKGMTLYMFTKDSQNQSNCSGGCLKAWPPLLTTGKPVAGQGVDASGLGVITTPSGQQVTYDGHPLYYFAKDTKPGDTTGQNVGNVWFVLKP